MKTSNIGSAQFTEFAGNVTLELSDKFRVGAQIYDRNLGQLGKWRPQLDWAVASYKFAPSIGIRGGKVKTVMGLYNDTQDFDFLRTPILLPQSVYPTDVRDTTIAHTGGDVYGDIKLSQHGGTLSYTAYAGWRNDSKYGGYAYLIGDLPGQSVSAFNYLKGRQFGWDLRWATPVTGLLVGASRLDEDLKAQYAAGTPGETNLKTKFNWTNQFYAQYSWKNLQLDSEYRQFQRGVVVNSGSEFQTHVQGWYVAAYYRLPKSFQVGGYYSNYQIDIPANRAVPPGKGHDYDKVVTLRHDFNRHLNVKVEAHVMDGYGLARIYPNGYYRRDNPQGLKDKTNALLVKTSFNF
jgi:hypothetical protein